MNSEEKKIRLNRFLAHAGFGKRKETEVFIIDGSVKVNGKVVKEPGTKVYLTDEVIVNGKKAEVVQHVYALWNRGYDNGEYYTKTLDSINLQLNDQLNFLANISVKAINPMPEMHGGLHILTSDPAILEAEKEYQFLYKIECNRKATKLNLENLRKSPGVIEVEPIEHDQKHILGIEAKHTNWAEFEKILKKGNLKVEKLDCVHINDFNKNNLIRGKWRLMTEQEVNKLKRHITV